PSCLLTGQEEALLGLSNSIYNCETGQRDGLTIYYNGMPREFHLAPRTDSSLAAKLDKMAWDAYQLTLNDIFNSPQFLMTFLDTENPVETLHQILYIKNRLFRHIALNHTLTFDLYGHVINSDLLNSTTEQL